MTYYSDDRQDEFVANLLKFKKEGHYLDIGSGASVGSNNTYFFESLNWKGICIDKNPVFNDSYKTRTCRYINGDALSIDYEKTFIEENFPFYIDYLSLDVDGNSTDVLYTLPLSEYRFKVITIEHDSHDGLYKERQRALLKAYGYYLLCQDVLNISGRNIGQEHAWEDWWADPSFFEDTELEKVHSFRMDAAQIIQKFNKK